MKDRNTMSNKKWRTELTTVKVPTLAMEAFYILQERYGSKRIGDAVLRFIEECDADLIDDAEKALNVKQELKGIYKGKKGGKN